MTDLKVITASLLVSVTVASVYVTIEAAVPGSPAVLQGASDCSANVQAPRGPSRRKTFREGKWQVTVHLGPCVSDAEAWQILSAIRGGRLVDGQVVPPHPIADRVLDPYPLPVIDASLVTSIVRTTAGEFDLPPHKFEITTYHPPELRGRGRGLVIFGSLRDGNLEIVGAGGWEI